MKGPIRVNNTFYISFTQALVKNNPDFEQDPKFFPDNIIGFVTIVCQATSVLSVTKNLNLEDGSRMALIRVVGDSNRTEGRDGVPMNYSFVFPSPVCTACYGQNYSLKVGSPSFLSLINATYGSSLSYDLNGYGKTSLGYAPVSSISQIWAVMIFQAHSVMYQPIRTLRDILLASVFAIGFGVCLTTFLLSGWVVKPITRLRAATEQSSSNPDDEPKYAFIKRLWYKVSGKDTSIGRNRDEEESTNLSKHSSATNSTPEFRLPEKVVTRKFIKDELTELTETFNDMTSELRKQYEVLEERVNKRTKEIKSAKMLAETANEAKSLFIANITHELRTPLNGILGMASVSMGETDRDAVQEALKVIFKSGELLLRLLTDLLSFSPNKIQAMTIEPKGFRIAEVISQLHAIFDEQCNARELSFSIALNTPSLYRLELYGDLNRILQVVMNLTSNSMKFTKSGEGKICVKLSATVGSLQDLSTNNTQQNLQKTDVVLYKKLDDGHQNLETVKNLDGVEAIILRIDVEDNGSGIAPHLQAKIFEPFVQGDLALSEKRGGVGLGLSICKTLTNMMSGELSVSSEVGVGSTFSFVVPFKVLGTHEPLLPSSLPDPPIPEESRLELLSALPDADSKKLQSAFTKMAESGDQQSVLKLPKPVIKKPVSPPSSPSSRAFGGITALIAEDNRVNQEVLVRMLNLEGVKDLIVTKDGLEAIQAVRDRQAAGLDFDVIFMDIQMPNLDGKQATEVIRKELHFKGKIIAVSAFTSETNIADCLKVGMDSFLAKPLHRKDLHSFLSEFTNHTPSLPPSPESSQSSQSPSLATTVTVN